MIIAAIILFIIAAVFGLYVLSFILRDLPTPKPAVLFHGPIAATGLVLVIIALVIQWTSGGVSGLLLASAILFVLAALGGFTLFAFDLTHRPIPKALALLHPLVAATGLVLLIIYFATS